MKQFVIGMVGLPASGKSTLAKKISKELNISHINNDKLREYFINNIKSYEKAYYYDTNSLIRSINRIVRPATNLLIKELLELNENFIIDGYGKTKLKRNKIKALIKKYNYKIIIVYIKVKENLILNRLKKRDKKEGTKWVKSYFSRWKDEFNEPKKNECDFLIEVSNFNKGIEEIKNIIKNNH